MIHKLPRWIWFGAAVLSFIAGIVNAVGFLGFQHQGVTHLMKKNKITVHMGTGALKGAGKLEVTGEKGVETFAAKHIIIATGARSDDEDDAGLVDC